MSINQKAIEIKALNVLEAYNIKEPVIDVAKIAEGEGIKIKEIKMPEGYKNIAGFFDKNEKIIYIELSDSPQRKLFSIAHELGHVFLNHQHATVLYRVTRENEDDYPEVESEANSFAAHLLMPDFMLKEYMKKYNLTNKDYKIMASLFGVPISSMTHMLTYLK